MRLEVDQYFDLEILYRLLGLIGASKSDLKAKRLIQGANVRRHV